MDAGHCPGANGIRLLEQQHAQIRKKRLDLCKNVSGRPSRVNVLPRAFGNRFPQGSCFGVGQSRELDKAINRSIFDAAVRARLYCQGTVRARGRNVRKEAWRKALFGSQASELWWPRGSPLNGLQAELLIGDRFFFSTYDPEKSAHPACKGKCILQRQMRQERRSSSFNYGQLGMRSCMPVVFFDHQSFHLLSSILRALK